MAPLTQFPDEPSWGSGHFVIVYVPKAQSKKRLERISCITLVFGEIYLVFGHFDLFHALLEPPDPVLG